MGFVALFGKIELDISTTVSGTCAVLTDVPGTAIAQRYSWTVPITTRRVLSSRIPNNTLGHLLKVTFTTTGQAKLYGARIWARALPGGPWQWYALPVLPTSAGWEAVPLPIPRTAEEWVSIPLPVDPTSITWEGVPLPILATGDWSMVPLPIPQTGEWTDQRLPIKPTPIVPDWVSIEVDE